MYSIKELFNKEPNAIREAVITILGILVMTDVVSISADAVAGIGVGVSIVLGLFYVRAKSVSKAALEELSG